MLDARVWLVWALTALVVASSTRNPLYIVILLLIALVAAMMVSYIRARAESLGFSCKVGLLTRMERIALIGTLCALGLPIVMAWALAVLSVVTVIQRIIHVYLSSREDDYTGVLCYGDRHCWARPVRQCLSPRDTWCASPLPAARTQI